MYDMNYDTSDKEKTDGSAFGDPDYEFYQMQLSDASGDRFYTTYTSTVTLPQGSYQPQRLAEYITDELSYSTPMIESDDIETRNNMLITTNHGGSGPHPDGGVANLGDFPEGDGELSDSTVNNTSYFPYFGEDVNGADAPNRIRTKGGNAASPTTDSAGSGASIVFDVQTIVTDFQVSNKYHIEAAGSGYQVADQLIFSGDQLEVLTPPSDPGEAIPYGKP
eukprot:m.189802 g.189802  ORF g.189802 m.189802 type:complete len:221 (-) comp25675_c0_seq3:355-1017(-)